MKILQGKGQRMRSGPSTEKRSWSQKAPKDPRLQKYDLNEEASLADQFIACTHIAKWGKHVTDAMLRYRIQMRHAHRFVLTDEFVEMATTMSLVPPEKTLARIQYATLPYDTTWIEFNLHAKMKALAEAKTTVFNPEHVSKRLGMLLQRINDTMSVCTLVSGSGDTVVMPHMTCFYLSTAESNVWPRRFGCAPLTRDDYPIPDDVHELVKASLWGYTEPELTAHNAVLRIPAFLAQHGEVGSSAMSMPMIETLDRRGLKKNEGTEVMIQEMREFTGTTRWLVTVLAMMNEVPISTEAVTPTGYQRAGRLGKNRLLDYHKVSLVLPKTNPVKWLHKRLSHEEIKRRRAHEVRAHWRTYLHAQHCGFEDHEWVYDHEHGYRLCGVCEAYSRLIHEHIRGNVALGWVRKEYVVKAAT